MTLPLALLLVGCAATTAQPEAPPAPVAPVEAPAATPEVDEEQQREAAFLEAIARDPRIADRPADLTDDEMLKVGYLFCKELIAGAETEGSARVWAHDQTWGTDATLERKEALTTAAKAAVELCPDWYKP